MTAIVHGEPLVRQSTKVDKYECALDAVKSAINVAGCGKVEYLASHMDKHKSQISRVLNGERRMSIADVLSLPVAVQRILAERWFKALGGEGCYPADNEEVAVSHILSGVTWFLKSVNAPREATVGAMRWVMVALGVKKRMAQPPSAHDRKKVG